MTVSSADLSKPCYCGSQKSFQYCCYPCLSGSTQAVNAEALMRSRFSAFCMHNAKYLMTTLHPSKRESNDTQFLQDNFSVQRWLSLQVLNSTIHSKGNQATVNFLAYFENQKSIFQHSELSQFVLERGRWFYLQGDYKTEPVNLGRNELCWCGNHKKYKKCHGL